MGERERGGGGEERKEGIPFVWQAFRILIFALEKLFIRRPRSPLKKRESEGSEPGWGGRERDGGFPFMNIRLQII